MFGSNYIGTNPKLLVSELNKSFLYQATLELKRPFIPKRCYISNKLLWLKPAYKATRRYAITYNDAELPNVRWYDKSEFLLQMLEGPN